MQINPVYKFLLGCLLICCCAGGARGTVYYVSETGRDDTPGNTAEQTWRTVRKVNAAPIAPGDMVLFQRGNSWREQLRPHRGNASAVVTYGAYGEGPKPALLGSIELNHPNDWQETSPNLWSSRPPKAIGEPLLLNPDFSEEDAPWHLHYEGGAQASSGRNTQVYDSAPAAYHVTCKTPGTSGSHIQCYTRKFSIAEGACYQLTFRVKSSAPVSFDMPTLMKAGPPYRGYATQSSPAAP